jgi:hypothetical protein
MLNQSILAAAAMAFSLSAAAAPQWAAVSGNNADDTFVDRSSYFSQGDLVDVGVLRIFDEQIALGNDPETGKAVYPHRSVKLTYKVNCDAGTIAMSEWTMFDGSFGDGEVVWDVQVQDELAFTGANDEETRAVMRSTCATTTASR